MSALSPARLTRLDNLPDGAFCPARHVETLLAVAPVVLDRRVRDGEFPAPTCHGRNRLWLVGAVRAYQRAIVAGHDAKTATGAAKAYARAFAEGGTPADAMKAALDWLGDAVERV